MGRFQFKEPDTITEEDMVLQVMTDKGIVCMTLKQYDEYLKNEE